MAGGLREAAMKTPKQVEAIENTLIDTITKLTEDGHQEIHVLETMLGLPGAPIMTGPKHWPGCSAISPMSVIGVPMPPWKSEQPIEPRSLLSHLNMVAVARGLPGA
jgi:hypothetical protein